MTRVAISVPVLLLLTLAAACGSSTANGPQAAMSLAFRAQPVPATDVLHPQLGAVEVDLLTSTGDVALGATGTVSIALVSTDTSARLSGTTTVTATVGRALFTDLSVAHAGTYRLVARMTGLDSTTSQAFTIAPAFHLAFGTLAVNETVGTPLPKVVRLLDAAGNLVTNTPVSVTLALTRTGDLGYTSAPDGVFGTTTATTVNGVASFPDVTVHRAGTYTVTASSQGVTSASASESFMSYAPTKLVFASQPQGAAAGAPLPSFLVAEVDDYGNGITLPPGPTYRVTIALANNPTGATLGGTVSDFRFGSTPIPFTDITVSKPGTGYTIVATSGSWSVTSAPFNVP